MTKPKHPPSVDVSFLEQLIKSSPKYSDSIVVGDTTAHVLKGEAYVGKRTIILRNNISEADYDYAVALAYKLGKIVELMKWLEEHKSWVDGGYSSKKT